MKAMIVNRIGDVGVVIGMVISYGKYKTLEYTVIMTMGEGGEVKWIGYMILVGAIGKSAQIGLHV
jgi:NADH-quinone oxidoreductase subunit L